ncbi:lysosome-associated membrane glycoprotein 1-like [Acanthaster planci]|uniref:Lysosome-associated membrane glycoprotein 5 n=1 Tax=Acanthaster planci TaxID=133434 RepID=A0A8B7YQU7_ACAPL|nr:lysosome-associated membrane glycoprotein 1-like [Acanthaster planci]
MEVMKRFSCVQLVFVLCLSSGLGITAKPTNSTAATIVLTNTTSPTPVTIATSPTPVTIATSPTPVTIATTPTPVTNATTPTHTTKATTPTHTTNATTPTHTTNATTSSPASNATTETPTTTVTPVPPGVGNWSIKGANGTVCMRMSFGAQLNISYTKTDKSRGTVVVNVNPKQADLTSDCNASSTRSLTIYPFGLVDIAWLITLTFRRQSEEYSLTSLEASWDYDMRFHDSAQKGFASASVTQDNFLMQEVTLGNSYTCPDPLTVLMSEATLRLSHMQLQPFAEKAGGKFGPAEECASGLSLTIIIIIAVAGAVLLVAVVVLIAVVARRMKKKYRVLENE